MPDIEDSTLAASIPASVRRKLASIDTTGLEHTPDQTPEQVRAEVLQRQADVAMSVWTRSTPPIYADATLGDFTDTQQAQAAQVAMAWLNSDALTLVIGGTVGTGKTRLACAIGREAARRRERPVFITASKLLRAMRPDGDQATASRATGARLLILDDLGVTRGTEWAGDALTELMDDRLGQGLRTVITTNSGTRELAQIYGERLIDRIKYRAAQAVLVGPSRRTPYGQENPNG